MRCQICGKNQANVYLKQVVNGEETELSLCEDCARNFGVSNIMEDSFDSGFDEFFGSLFSNFSSLPYGEENFSTVRCKGCGTTFSDISSTGRVGCANCYSTFSRELLPYIRRIHGNTKHVGKVAACCGGGGACTALSRESKLNSLKKKLEEAVEKQEFEQAAILRDEIKALSSEGKS